MQQNKNSELQYSETCIKQPPPFIGQYLVIPYTQFDSKLTSIKQPHLRVILLSPMTSCIVVQGLLLLFVHI